MTDNIWRKKLAGWVHDPAEKALVLLQDPSGHEGGTVRVLREELGLQGASEIVKTADHWASAADRPQWPRNADDGRFAAWSQVRFADAPILIHPLTGREFDLRTLQDIDYKKIKAVSQEHFKSLRDLGNNDDRLTYLAFWRFGCELDHPDLKTLWRVLPADTRVPDHTIWNHLDTVSAFAGAMDDPQGPALLSMSFGPVQGFIAQARSTSDLWAGSHLLSTLVWEAMKTVAEEIGPDAFLFPHLRGLAVADAWLLTLAKKNGVEESWKKRFNNPPWLSRSTDANPLFAACLPNKLLALVPRSRAESLAKKAVEASRSAAKTWAIEAGKKVTGTSTGYWLNQIEKQLVGFPQIFWAVADWPGASTGKACEELVSVFHRFVPKDAPENFFAQPVWNVLSKSISIDGVKFFEPNPGILYPAVFAVSERLLASVKSTRPFEALEQQGYRCTLCGEREWLTEKPEALILPPGDRKKVGTPWEHAAGTLGIKPGEHLCGICALKRVWPTIFTEMVQQLTELDGVKRYVVSTHTMALATTLDQLIDKVSGEMAFDVCERLYKHMPPNLPAVALPRRLIRKIPSGNPRFRELVRTLPAAFDKACEASSSHDCLETSRIASLDRELKNIIGSGVEKYYALVLMDGDSMGAWLAGNDPRYRLPFKACWHPQIRARIGNGIPKSDNLDAYLNSPRPASPGRHASISQALNHFSSILAPFIVEETVKGKLLYAGGDDVLAMVSVDDLLEAMISLRCAYSGIEPPFDLEGPHTPLKRKNGFALLGDRLLQVMGDKATASLGAVIAHHQTPLSVVLRTLREAEQEAKASGRNAFSIHILKRSGGALSFTDAWGTDSNVAPDSTFCELRALRSEFSAREEVSRRAAYASSTWLKDLPQEFADGPAGVSATMEMAQALLAHQFTRHGGNPDLARRVVSSVWRSPSIQAADRIERLIGLLSTAEFLARETRSALGSTKGGVA